MRFDCTSKVKVKYVCKLCIGLPRSYTQGLPWLRICCSQHFSQMEKLEPNANNFSQGFSQKVVSTSCYYVHVYARGNFCCLLITFANSLAPDQAQHFVGPDLDPNCLHPDGIEKKSSIQRVKYGTIIKCEGIIQPMFENPKANKNTLFRKYASFEPLANDLYL